MCRTSKLHGNLYPQLVQILRAAVRRRAPFQVPKASRCAYERRRLVCRFSNAGYDNAIHGLMRPAFEKRQGTKSREVREKRCRGRYGDLMSAPASMAGATPARGDLRVCTQASLGAENWLSGDAQSASTGARRIDRRDWAERDRRWGAASGSELERRNAHWRSAS
jgi:hypothetical protein